MKKIKWYQMGERRFRTKSLVSYHYRMVGKNIDKYNVDSKTMLSNGYKWAVVLCFADGDSVVNQYKTEGEAGELIRILDNMFKPAKI